MPFCGRVAADIASCVEVNEFYEDTFEPENEDNIKEHRLLHNVFESNYIRILHGELPKWVLGVVRINRSGIAMAFFERETGYWEDLYAKWTPMLKFMFEVDRADGSGVDTYLVEMSADDQDTEKNHRLKVTEHDAYGKRKLVFTTLYDKPDGSDENWKYVYVTEYR